jgi:hypothetical protein
MSPSKVVLELISLFQSLKIMRVFFRVLLQSPSRHLAKRHAFWKACRNKSRIRCYKSFYEPYFSASAESVFVLFDALKVLK